MKKIFLACIAILSVGLMACDDDKDTRAGEVHANSEEAYSGEYNSITLDATIYGDNVTDRGVVYGTENLPTLEDNVQQEGSGAGKFTAVVEGLDADTRYYIRSYAIANGQTIYGTTRAVSTTPYLNTNITGTTPELMKIKVEADVKDGVEYITVRERGVVYRTSETPENTGTKVVAAQGGKGNFSVTITDLEMDTKYYIQSYAISEEGTIFSETKEVSTTDPGTILEYGAIYNKDNKFVMHYSFDIDENTPANSTITVTYIKADGDADRVTRNITFDDAYTQVTWPTISNNGIDFRGITWAKGEFEVLGTEGLSVATGISSEEIYRMFVKTDNGGYSRCSELANGNHHSSIGAIWSNFGLIEINGGYNGLMTRYKITNSEGKEELDWLCMELASANGKPNIPVNGDIAKFSFGSFFWQDDADIRQDGWDDLEPFRKLFYNPEGVIIVFANKHTGTIQKGGFDYYMISADGKEWAKWFFRVEGT